MVQEIKSLDEFKQLINSGKVIIIDFWAAWCGPCRQISPIFEKLAEQTQNDNVGFYKVNVDDLPDVSQEVGIRAMPTFMVFKDGQKVEELVGANPPRLQELITKAVPA